MSSEGVLPIGCVGQIYQHEGRFCLDIQGTEGWIAQVLQLEKDKDIHEDEIFKVGHRVMEKWTRDLGMSKMFNQTNKVARARYFERFGYEIKRWISVKDLNKED